jgi:hypothetical protein
MHRSEHRNRKHRTPRLELPDSRFRQPPDQCLQARRSFIFRLGPDARADLSLACNESRSHGLHSRVKAPGLPLRFLPAASTTRSALRSTTDFPVCAGSAASSLKPVAAFTPDSACCFPGLHSPFGLLHPSGSKRSAGLAASWPAFRNRPIPVRSPPPLSITSYRLRINVPESLPLRRLAVPQTSWNLIHYAPDREFRQQLKWRFLTLFLCLFPVCL